MNFLKNITHSIQFLCLVSDKLFIVEQVPVTNVYVGRVRDNSVSLYVRRGIETG